MFESLQFDMDKTDVTPNVSIKETQCKCGCELGYATPIAIDPNLRNNISLLARNNQTLLIILSLMCQGRLVRVLVDSWCRCPEHNAHPVKDNPKIKGAPNSKHLYGGAADLRFQYWDREWKSISPIVICRAALLLSGNYGSTEFKGIGLYRNRVHLDIGPRFGIKTWIKKDSGEMIYDVDFENVNFG